VVGGITMKELTSLQRDELIEQYTSIVVDSMDMDALVQYAQEQLANYMDGLSDVELKEDINNYDDNDGLYEELVDNVTQQYAKQLNQFEKERLDTSPYDKIPERY
tara:strand:- start:893 stop:1207 length:315 start_codon:yes stop_codon:yes gene_type:complete